MYLAFIIRTLIILKNLRKIKFENLALIIYLFILVEFDVWEEDELKVVIRGVNPL